MHMGRHPDPAVFDVLHGSDNQGKKIEVYPISVIIEGDNDDYYVNFKKGMDQAAVEFHGDVSFITLYASDDQDQQMDLVKREIRDGTRAVRRR